MLFAFERYVQQSGLLGTPDKCAQMVDWMQAVGVNEIACLVDFGVAQNEILESLGYLSQLCTQYAKKSEE